MTIPFTPPTDNLWKLIAIGGFILVVVGLVVPYERAAALDELKAEASGVARGIDLRMDLVAQEAERLKGNYARIATQPSTQVAESRAIFDRRADELEARVHRDLDALGPLAEKLVAHNFARDVLATRAWKFHLLVVLGSVMVVVGVWRWLPIQSQQDQLLRLQVQKAAAELAREKAAQV